MLSVCLEKWGHEVVSTSNGQEALQVLLEPDAPRLAILDWMMPGLDGLEVTRRLRQALDAPFVYIILLTSKDEKENVVQALDAGADDYLTKPYNAEELRSRVGVGARLVALQAELEAANEKLTHIARTDHLTQLSNRGAIMDQLARELNRAQRHATSLAVAMVDVDHFKAINDTLGHAGGDLVLMAVAQRLQTGVRTYDLVGRFGGEEFLIVFPELDAENARTAIERVVQGIRETPVRVDEAEVHVTVSVGAVWCSGASLKSRNTDSIIRTADQQLYEAKNAGRNLVCLEMCR